MNVIVSVSYGIYAETDYKENTVQIKNINMTQEDKQLLFKDLCARLPYRVKVQYTSKLGEVIVKELRGSDIEVLYDGYHPERYKPYLRPMSSMTDEEREEWTDLFMVSITQELEQYTDELEAEKVAPSLFAKSHTLSIDWLNAHHFDYRGLIEKGLALEAPEGMYMKGE